MMGGSGYGMMGNGMGWGMGSSDPWALYLGWLYHILVLVLILVWTGAGIMVFLYFRKKMP